MRAEDVRTVRSKTEEAEAEKPQPDDLRATNYKKL
jgi:hypothetical protein